MEETGNAVRFSIGAGSARAGRLPWCTIPDSVSEAAKQETTLRAALVYGPRAFCRWRERMEALPTVKNLRATLPPRAPIEHAREWAISHRPKY